MFKWLNKQGVESDRGFAVQCVGRFEIEYREGSKKISVSVENGIMGTSQPCVIISPKAFERWDNYPETLSPKEQEEKLANFIEAMEFQGLSVSVE